MTGIMLLKLWTDDHINTDQSYQSLQKWYKISAQDKWLKTQLAKLKFCEHSVFKVNDWCGTLGATKPVFNMIKRPCIQTRCPQWFCYILSIAALYYVLKVLSFRGQTQVFLERAVKNFEVGRPETKPT